MAITSNQDKCPRCGNEMEWGIAETTDFGVVHSADCSVCDFEGNQILETVFVCWQDSEDNEFKEYSKEK